LQVGKGGKLTQYPELAGQAVVVLVEDREGTVWVATLNGLDRFRDFTVATLTVRQGLSSARVNSVLADSEGGVWLATAGGLDRWNNGLITVPRTGTAKQDGKLNGRAPESLFQDDRGRIWISTSRGVGYLANNRFILISGVPGGLVSSITEDTEGNVWIANLDHGLFRVSLQSQVQQIPWAVLGRKDFATALAADFGDGPSPCIVLRRRRTGRRARHRLCAPMCVARLGQKLSCEFPTGSRPAHVGQHGHDQP